MTILTLEAQGQALPGSVLKTGGDQLAIDAV
jgi:hypothetical protein